MLKTIRYSPSLHANKVSGAISSTTFVGTGGFVRCLIFIPMRTKFKTKPAERPVIDEIDVDALIEELRQDIAANRHLENDKNWLKYCWPQIRREAERICNELQMSPVEREMVLSGQRKSYDKEWEIEVPDQRGSKPAPRHKRRKLKKGCV
jgi:hypothetical protein